MLNRQTYFIREHIGFLKLSDTYDILDAQTQSQLGIAREKPGALILALRLLVDKRMLPTSVFVYEGTDHEAQSHLQFSIERGFSLFRSRVNVCDKHGQVIGYMRSKAFSIGGAFYVFDASDKQVAFVKGDWKGWNFRFLDNQENETGTITKKWAGIGKELFTSADNYIIALNQTPTPETAMLLLAAGLAVDTIYKES